MELPAGGKTESVCAYGWRHTESTGVFGMEHRAWSKPRCCPSWTGPVSCWPLLTEVEIGGGGNGQDGSGIDLDSILR
jgi:hypothetical protein